MLILQMLMLMMLLVLPSYLDSHFSCQAQFFLPYSPLLCFLIFQNRSSEIVDERTPWYVFFSKECFLKEKNLFLKFQIEPLLPEPLVTEFNSTFQVFFFFMKRIFQKLIFFNRKKRVKEMNKIEVRKKQRRE